MSPARIKTLIAAHGDVDVASLQRMVATEPGLELVGVIDNDSDWAGRAARGAEALLIACGGPSATVLALIQEQTSVDPTLPVVVLCAGSPNGFVRQVFESGADDIVVTEGMGRSGPEIFFAIEKAMTRKRASHADAGQPQGHLICVLGPKGGTGKTLTSSNLAAALAGEGRRVVVVDLDLQFGDLGLVMGITPERSIFDLVTAGGTLDASKVDAFLAHHPSGARVLLAPTRPDHASAITPEFLRDLYAVLRQEYQFVVVDTPPGFTAEVIATIDSATSVCLIGTLDAPSLKNAKLGAETLELMGYPPERVRVVLNRADTSVGVSHADAVAILGRAPDVLIPSSREIVRSVNAGDPIVVSSPRSEAAKAFRALAQLFIGALPGQTRQAAEGTRRARGLRGALARS